MRFQWMKAGLAFFAAVAMAAGASVAQAQGGAVLTRDDVAKLLPEKVYYKGQSAPAQLRNSGGIKFADGYLVLATLVDNSGYSTGIAEKYQAYLVVETPIKVGGKTLGAGVYGIGFVEGDKLLISDIGAHEVLSVSTKTDAEIKRPMPLEIVADAAGGFRLYAGRRWVAIAR